MGSPFASYTQQTIAIPWDDPHTVTIRRLAGRHEQKARDVAQAASVAALKRLGGAAFQRELTQAGGGDPAKVAALVAQRQADPLNGFDRYTVLAKGIVAWTYDEPLTPVEVLEDDGTKAWRIPAIDDLDDVAADWLARAIVALLPARDEAAQKNG